MPEEPSEQEPPQSAPALSVPEVSTPGPEAPLEPGRPTMDLLDIDVRGMTWSEVPLAVRSDVEQKDE